MTVLRNTICIEAPPEPIGAALDALFVRRKWDVGVKSFFRGLKRYVEAPDAA